MLNPHGTSECVRQWLTEHPQKPTECRLGGGFEAPSAPVRSRSVVLREAMTSDTTLRAAVASSNRPYGVPLHSGRPGTVAEHEDCNCWQAGVLYHGMVTLRSGHLPKASIHRLPSTVGTASTVGTGRASFRCLLVRWASSFSSATWQNQLHPTPITRLSMPESCLPTSGLTSIAKWRESFPGRPSMATRWTRW